MQYRSDSNVSRPLSFDPCNAVTSSRAQASRYPVQSQSTSGSGDTYATVKINDGEQNKYGTVQSKATLPAEGGNSKSKFRLPSSNSRKHGVEVSYGWMSMGLLSCHTHTSHLAA